jgi:hypothetical protein
VCVAQVPVTVSLPVKKLDAIDGTRKELGAAMLDSASNSWVL